MAATASDTAPDEHRRVESESIARSTPGFTAVNGRPSASPPEKNKSHPEQTKEASESSAFRAIQPNNQQDRAPTPSSSRPARPESQLEHRASPPPPSSMDRSYQAPRSQGPPDEPRPQSVNGQTRNDSINQSNHVNGSPQKRKRSDSDEYNNPDSSAFHSHSLPPPPPDQRMYPAETNGRPRESEPRSPPQSYPRPSPLHPYGRPDHAPPHGSYPQPERHQLVRNEYDHSFDPHITPAQQRQPYYPDPHDAHLAHELSRDLQRDNNNYEPPLPGREQFMTPEEEDHHYGEYNPNMSAAQREMDRKRRKRVFSNRTKTGCMTCRRRKKKCDEQHPECMHTSFAHRPPLYACRILTIEQAITASVAGSSAKVTQSGTLGRNRLMRRRLFLSNKKAILHRTSIAQDRILLPMLTSRAPTIIPYRLLIWLPITTQHPKVIGSSLLLSKRSAIIMGDPVPQTCSQSQHG